MSDMTVVDSFQSICFLSVSCAASRRGLRLFSLFLLRLIEGQKSRTPQPPDRKTWSIPFSVLWISQFGLDRSSPCDTALTSTAETSCIEALHLALFRMLVFMGSVFRARDGNGSILLGRCLPSLCLRNAWLVNTPCLRLGTAAAQQIPRSVWGVLHLLWPL